MTESMRIFIVNVNTPKLIAFYTIKKGVLILERREPHIGLFNRDFA